jgi:flagellar hook-length control protein FliK
VPAPASIVTNFATGGPAVQQSAKAADAVALRDQTSKAETSKAIATAKQPAQAATLRADFAEVLARRLEKTSVFEMRLDPPEHGRVEGRLAIADDGKAILSLTFDNQSAFDLFSRDEQLLRQTLGQAGLDFASGDFRFSYREQVPIEGAADLEATAAINTDRNYEAAFHADWSAGALDIRI